MKATTKERLTAIAAEIRTAAFMAEKAKNPREHFNTIHTLAREACDYFAFGLEAEPPKPEPVEEPVEFGFTCGVFECPHDDYEMNAPGYSTMGEALDAARAHALTHDEPRRGIVTTEKPL